MENKHQKKNNQKQKIKATYRFPNGNIVTFDYNDEQMPELQGMHTPELYKKIKQHSDSKTLFYGF